MIRRHWDIVQFNSEVLKILRLDIDRKKGDSKPLAKYIEGLPKETIIEMSDDTRSLEWFDDLSSRAVGMNAFTVSYPSSL